MNLRPIFFQAIVLLAVAPIANGAALANALQTGRFKWLEVAMNDADLHRVVTAWGKMPVAIRRAMLALVVSQ